MRTRSHPVDGRVRVAELTDAGVRERADLDARSREGIGELLDRLTAGQRAELIEAQEQIRRLLRLAAVTVRGVDAGTAVARQCLRAYAAELAVRFPEGYDDAAVVDPAELTGDAGALVAYEEEQPVGSGAWRRLGAGDPAPRPGRRTTSSPSRKVALSR